MSENYHHSERSCFLTTYTRKNLPVGGRQPEFFVPWGTPLHRRHPNTLEKVDCPLGDKGGI